MSEIVRITSAIKGKVPDKAIPWIVGQSAHETGNWKSGVYKRLNNGFGMLHPKRRPTLSTGGGSAQPTSEGGGKYATYRNLEDSAKDLVLWLKYNRVPWTKINNADQYVAWIKSKGYFGATESEYLKGIKYWINKLKLPAVASATIGIVIIAGLVTYLIMSK